jgi:hypothetical protein
MRAAWLCVGVLVCAVVVATAQAHDSVKVEERTKTPASLGRNVRLDFKAVPLEEGDEGLYIITASSEFGTSVELEGEEGQLAFEVSGEIALLDDGRLFIRYEARVLIEGEEGEGAFSVRSSVILKPGQDLGVSRIGDKTLMIRASYVD